MPLCSIPQQQPQENTLLKTQSTLLKLYSQMFKLTIGGKVSDNLCDAKNIFKDLVKRVQCDDTRYNRMTYAGRPVEMKQKQVEQKYLSFMEKINKKQDQLNESSCSEESIMNLSPIRSLSPTSSLLNSVDTYHNGVLSAPKPLESTFSSNPPQPLKCLLQKLQSYNKKRLNIKMQLYSHKIQNPQNFLDSLYVKWSDLHKKMKEVLELLIQTLCAGKSVSEFYEVFGNYRNSTKKVQGYEERVLMSKIQNYLEMLFLDEREIIIYFEGPQAIDLDKKEKVNPQNQIVFKKRKFRF